MTFFHEKSAVLNGLEHIGIKSRSFAEKIEIRILIRRHIGIYLDDFVNLHVFGVPTGYGYPAMRVLIGKYASWNDARSLPSIDISESEAQVGSES